MANVIAVDLGGTNTRIAVVSPDKGTIIRQANFKTKTGDSRYIIAESIIETVKSLIEQENADGFAGIGISAAGPVDQKTGTLSSPPNIAFKEVPLKEPISSALGCQVEVINDCLAGVLGEVCYGQAQGKKSVVYITMSTGIGGGVFTDNRLLFGSRGNAGEIGHMIVDTVYNLKCSCGCFGHWEAYASGRSIPLFFRAWCEKEGISAEFPHSTPQEIFVAARSNKPAACSFLNKIAEINAHGISNVIVAYEPDMIILDGPVVQQNHELILDQMIQKTDRYLLLPDIVLSSLKCNSPLLGAAAYLNQKKKDFQTL